MNLKRTLMKGEKMSFHLSVLGLSVSLFAASGLGFFASPIAAQARNSVKQPKVATVESLVNGGIRYQNLGATFEICENENTFLNKKVFLVYRQVPVNDCQSAEPCGKTRQETLIIQMKVADFDNPHAQE
jgi:hypothetical protein